MRVACFILVLLLYANKHGEIYINVSYLILLPYSLTFSETTITFKIMPKVF